jgi:hypothetical protein
MTESTHGGRREGAGRKPKLEDARTVTVYMARHNGQKPQGVK